MTVKTIPPREAQALVARGAALIDIREPAEARRDRIAGARNVPLDQLDKAKLPEDVLIFHCRSGMRTGQAADRLGAASGGRDCYLLEGGLNAWARAGLPVERGSGPIELQRQVMIVAGSLVLLGTLLSLLVAPAFVWLAVAVGAGLTFSGLSGTCAMASLLSRMPWNRDGAAA